MTEPRTRFALLTPHRIGDAQADALVTSIGRAIAALDVAAIVLRLAPSDERSLVALVKRIAPAAAEKGAAVVVACPDFSGDLVSVSARGGADGVHLDRAPEGLLKDLRGRLKDGRILGAGGLESKHLAMEAGEAGVDYVMFGGLYPDGVAPDSETVLARAEWWAEIFEMPCIAVAATLDEIAPVAATGCEFVGLEASLWMEEGADFDAVRARLAEAASPDAGR